MKTRLKRKPNRWAIIALLMASFFATAKTSVRNSPSIAQNNVNLAEAFPRALLTDSSANDDATLNSPEMDSFLLIVAITVLGLTSVIGYYIITRGKGPH